MALSFPECTKHLGPIVPGIIFMVPLERLVVESKCFLFFQVPPYSVGFMFLALRSPIICCSFRLDMLTFGLMQFVLDPVHAAFNIGCMNRWLDFNGMSSHLFVVFICIFLDPCFFSIALWGVGFMLYCFSCRYIPWKGVGPSIGQCRGSACCCRICFPPEYRTR